MFTHDEGCNGILDSLKAGGNDMEVFNQIVNAIGDIFTGLTNGFSDIMGPFLITIGQFFSHILG